MPETITTGVDFGTQPSLTMGAIHMPARTRLYDTLGREVAFNDTDDSAWIHWNHSANSTTTATIWTSWVDNATTSTATNTITHGGLVYQFSTADGSLAVAPTPEQAAAQLVREQEQRAESRRIAQQMQLERTRIEGERQLARQKAQELLKSALDVRQQVQLAQNGWFEVQVHSKDGSRRRYRIHRGRHGNVALVDEQGKHLRRYCIHPMIDCPDEDTMLTQKLWLETNEELFLRTANAS